MSSIRDGKHSVLSLGRKESGQKSSIWTVQVKQLCKPHISVPLRTLKELQGCGQFFEFCECQSVVVVLTLHRTYGNPRGTCVYNDSIKSYSQNLQKFIWMFGNRETMFIMFNLFKFWMSFTSHHWVTSFSLIVCTCAFLPAVSPPISNSAVTHNVVTLNMTQLTMNLSRTVFFCLFLYAYRKFSHNW